MNGAGLFNISAIFARADTGPLLEDLVEMLRIIKTCSFGYIRDIQLIVLL